MQPSIVAAFYYKVPLQYFNTADFCELELYYWEVSFTLVKEVIVLELTPPPHLQNWTEERKRTGVHAAFWSVSVAGKDTWIYVNGKEAFSSKLRNSRKKKKAEQIILKELDEILGNLAYFIPYQFWLSNVKVSQK